MTAYFVAGTDTEIGKTFVTCTLLHAARNRGLTAIGMKPIAAGAETVNGEFINEDAARLRAAGSFDPGLALLNPYCLTSPIAPHIAAAEEGVRIDAGRIHDAFAALTTQADVVFVEGVGGFRVPLDDDYDTADLARDMGLPVIRADVVFVEGVGGFRVPLDDDYDTADLARDMGLPVILVVGMKLGCINHALLTAEAIAARGLNLAGWVANRIDPAMLRFEQNLDALRQRLSAPLLGVVPFQADGNPAAAAGALKLPF